MLGTEEKTMFDRLFGQDINTIKTPAQRPFKIVHMDLDAFYASVEERDDPSLKGKPLIIGGSPDSRGVVCTANYEARRFGVRSAMPCFKAKQLCPHGIFLAPRFYAYKEASKNVFQIFQEYTPLVQPMSLDEAYIDVTEISKNSSATEIARKIKHDIFQETKLTISAGVAPNKMLAKIASDLHKPNGICVIKPYMVSSFMDQLPIKKIPGIGPSSQQRLKDLGIERCGDLWQINYSDLELQMGSKFALWLVGAARGIDNRTVKPERKRKSYSSEHTFQTDVNKPDVLLKELENLTRKLCQSVKNRSDKGRTITIKLKDQNFQCITRSKTLAEYHDDPSVIWPVAKELFSNNWIDQLNIRLVGVGISNLAQKKNKSCLLT